MEYSLFAKLFRNSFIRKEILDNIKKIHSIIDLKVLKWPDVIKNLSILIIHNYKNEFKQYITDYINSRDNNKFGSSSTTNSASFIFYESIRVAVRYSRLEILDILLTDFQLKFDDHIKPSILLNEAAHSGQFETFKYLVDKLPHIEWQPSEFQSVFITAPLKCNLETIKWISIKMLDDNNNNKKQDLGLNINDYELVMRNAASVGNLDLVIWLYKSIDELHKKKKRINVDHLFHSLVNHSLLSGQINICDWLLDNNYLDMSRINIDIATLVDREKFESIKWAHEHFGPSKMTSTVKAMDLAAAKGRLDILKWLHFNRTEGCSTDAMDRAASIDIEIVKWLHENTTQGCTTDAMDNAAESGQLETIKWLHENRTEGSSSTAIESASAHSLELLQWFIENRSERITPGCFILSSFSKNSLDILKYLFKIVESYSNSERISASANIYLDILVNAVVKDNFEMVKFIIDRLPNDFSIFESVIFCSATRGTRDIFGMLLSTHVQRQMLELSEVERQQLIESEINTCGNTPLDMIKCLVKIVKHQNYHFIGDDFWRYSSSLITNFDLLTFKYTYENCKNLHEDSTMEYEDFLYTSTIHGTYDLVKYLVIEQKVTPTFKSLENAITYGYTDMAELFFNIFVNFIDNVNVSKMNKKNIKIIQIAENLVYLKNQIK